MQVSYVFNETKRIIFDLLIAALLVFVYTTGFYEELSSPLQLVSLKILLVSMGFIHAHITRKLVFKKVNWNGDWTPQKIIVIGLYIVIIYAYAQGG